VARGRISFSCSSCFVRLRSSRFSVSRPPQRRAVAAGRPACHRDQRSGANGPVRTRRCRSCARLAPSSDHPGGRPRSRRDGTLSDKKWARCRSFQRGRSLAGKESTEPWAVPTAPTAGEKNEDQNSSRWPLHTRHSRPLPSWRQSASRVCAAWRYARQRLRSRQSWAWTSTWAALRMKVNRQRSTDQHRWPTTLPAPAQGCGRAFTWRLSASPAGSTSVIQRA